ncbi:MAG: hypothetical protein R3E12_04075 [Candidatus Eisenbacteria bacterium]
MARRSSEQAEGDDGDRILVGLLRDREQRARSVRLLLAQATGHVKRRPLLRELLEREFGFVAPIKHIDHHFCHATSAYYTAGFPGAPSSRSTAEGTVSAPASTGSSTDASSI